MPRISAAYGCWNCNNTAPTHDNGSFKFLAIEEDLTGAYHDGERVTGEIHPICEACYGQDIETAHGVVLTVAQAADGTVEVE